MPAEFTESVIAEFPAHGGRVGGELAGTPIILIHHRGARTRVERVIPLAHSAQPDGQLVIAASNGGSPTRPAWYTATDFLRIAREDPLKPHTSTGEASTGRGYRLADRVNQLSTARRAD
jgi:F420H(2)-dependent quinone reductase